ncbi:MAG TPA: hypothetical protein PKY59_02645 [Pyrinomonadaceae bacterium]|nr:hypothetical protein [Pyrinomonadaceae bacterium]
MKSWFYKIFGVGKIRETLLNELKSEGIVASDEGLKSTLTYKNFRAPGRYSNWKRRWFAGAIILTNKRLILQQFSQPVINILLTDERFEKIKISLETEDTLLFEFEPQLFLENSSGEIEWRTRTPKAKNIHDRLKMSQ